MQRINWVSQEILSVDFLALESWESLHHILPCLFAISQRLDRYTNFILTCTDLLHRVSISKRNCAVFDGLEVDGDTERCAELVVPGVPLTNTGA